MDPRSRIHHQPVTCTAYRRRSSLLLHRPEPSHASFSLHRRRLLRLHRTLGLRRLRQPPAPAATAEAPAPAAACRWYRLTQGERSSKICSSKAHGLALMITDGEDRVQWQVTSIDAKPLPPDTFAIDDRGFVRN